MIGLKELGSQKTKEYTEAYNMYFPLICSVVYTKIQNYHEAEDICQELFLRFYQRFDEIENSRKWLFGALRNVMLEYYKNKTESTVDIDSLLNDIGMSYVNGFRDIRLILKEAIEDPANYENEKERTLFELVTINNYSYVECCTLLKMTYMQVRYVLDKVMKRMLVYLNAKGIKNLEDLL